MSLIKKVSLSCKCLREKLKSKVFKKVNANKLAESIAQIIGNDDVYSKKFQLIDGKYNSIKKFVTSLSFNVLSKYNYIHVTCGYFNNLSNLILEVIIIPSTILINIFNNTKTITKLSLNDNMILFSESSKSAEELNFPKSLKALEMRSNSALSTPHWEDPIASYAAFAKTAPDTILINLKYGTKLPNLLYLDIWDTEDKLENILKDFLIDNSQLKFINILFECLNLQIYELLTKCEQLQEVKIVSVSRFSPAAEGQNEFNLPSVKRLTLDEVLYRRQPLLSYLISPFVNITNLKICYIEDWPQQLCDQIKKFNNLEKLTVYKSDGCLQLNEPFISSKSLKVLEFVGFSKLGFDLKLTCECPKIKTVRVNTLNFNASGLEELSQDLSRSSDDWAILKFNETVNCYKK
ncbi:hypothetical protein CONCODRAFT_74475 [Conidiobolus coronatus NRRL 28638]|uniref:F-box domain-containing protein n=1 Tax=Conidiobolus coronatus (strain ATCC 28846 / CBS 209.66 / NRRL 28638) TaxID=796925 RepID=A0A137NQN9_CONC2|nr:hypothetical protein CONCODRAFT_74475 [Conidiobolus coronatus NRRL 28638]|eukprot:KXN65077.1 hypothetical protein CONCODRAFT_74475 [Conidiobolus coronatus NRRL 28638]